MKTIVITGASQGIGRAVALAFAPHATHLALCARTAAKLEAVAAEARAINPKLLVLVQPADVSTRTGCHTLVEAVLAQCPPVDVLVNNAGVFLPGQLQNEAEGTLETQLATNLQSAYHITRGLLPGMVERQTGHIFTMCSTASIVPYVNGGSYGISKFALLGFTKVLREELKQSGIRVTAVLPGATETDSWNGSGVPAARMMPPEDVAAAVLACWQMHPRTVVEELLLRPQLGDL